jgi:hypothetical protein
MQIQFPHYATLDFRDVVTAMVPFVRHAGISIVANDDGVFVTALTKNVDLKFRIPGAAIMRTGNVTVSVFDLRDILRERTIKSAKQSLLTLAVNGKKTVDLSIAGRSWQLDRLAIPE